MNYKPYVALCELERDTSPARISDHCEEQPYNLNTLSSFPKQTAQPFLSFSSEDGDNCNSPSANDI